MSSADIQVALESVGESDLEGALSEVRRSVQARQQAVGASYPIGVTSGGYQAAIRWQDCLPYAFLLLASLHHHYPQLRPPLYRQRIQEGAELFERLSAIALQTYVSGEVERFGSPRRPPVPAPFNDALEHLSRRSGEAVGSGLYSIGNEQDDGVDLLAWRPFPDRRPGQLIFFGQCAIGLDWDEKWGDLIEDHWRGHILWHVYPAKAFMVPFHHPEEEEWRRSCGAGGIVFDRLRISALVTIGEVPPDLAASLSVWCAQRIQDMSRMETIVAARRRRRRRAHR